MDREEVVSGRSAGPCTARSGAALRRAVFAAFVVLLLALLVLFLMYRHYMVSQQREASREREHLREQLGLDPGSNPIEFLGRRIEKEREARGGLSLQELDELVVGYSERHERHEGGTSVYYHFFIVRDPLFGGRYGGCVWAHCDEAGSVEYAAWEAAGPLIGPGS
jgi:hypothetical protein